MRNHLIIGLGGTGGRVIRALRKRIMLEYGDDPIVPPRQRPDNALQLGYLYVDSSNEMMLQNDESWRVLGRSVQLPPASQLLISGANIRAVLDMPQTHPAIRPWIGAPEQWAKVPANVIDTGAGGQRRRLGRFLFAMKVQDFTNKLNLLIADLRKATGQTDVHVHIVAGLAGGTGGGSFIDVLTQVSRSQAVVGDSRISLFAVLPERNSPWNAGNYYANGYAALRELNGLMIRKFRPHSLVDAGQQVDLDPTRVRGLYLITNENDMGVALDVGKDVPTMVADFLYERLLESQLPAPPIATNENSTFANETIPGTSDPIRARCFSSFGIKRVEYPENEIREYLAASLARAATYQLQYNNWSDEYGYSDAAINMNHAERVRDKARLHSWRLTDEHLKYISAILDLDFENARKGLWAETIAGEWIPVCDHFQQECAEAKLDRIELLPTFFEHMEDIFNNQGGYRKQGVPEYYQLKRAGRNDMARRIAELVEEDLLRLWQFGEHGWSLDDQIKTIRALREYLESQRVSFQKQMSTLQDTIRALEDEVGQQRDDAAHTSSITWPLKRSGILQRFAATVQALMVARTELAATGFAVDLIPMILDKISELQTNVEHLRTAISAALERLNRAIDSRLREEKAEANAAAVRRFDPVRVGQLRRRMVTDKPEMERLCADVRRVILDTPALRDRPRFPTLLEDLAGVALDQRLLQQCDTIVKSVHDNLVETETDRVLGVKLINRLRTDFGGDQETLNAFARDIVTKAKPFARVSQIEQVRDPLAVGAPADARLISTLAVQRPKPPELETFLKSLDVAFRDTQVGVEIADPPTSKDNALTVMSVHAGMPIRYLEVVGFLKAEYEKRLKTTVDLAKLEVHSEDSAVELPDIFVESGPPAQSLSYVLISQSLGIMFEDTNPETGRKEIVLKSVDDGFDKIVKIANKWAELPDVLSPRDFIGLKHIVDQTVRQDLVHRDRKQEIFDRIAVIVRDIGNTEGQRSDRYNTHREAAGRAKVILGLEAE